LSLATRLLGVLLTVSGGWLVGNAQGVITIANGVGSIILSLGIKMTTIGAIMGNYVKDLVTFQLTPDYGSYWVFGILLALGGFILVARGDRKPRDPIERAPLLQEPLYGKQQD
jgi:hypothetical protein